MSLQVVAPHCETVFELLNNVALVGRNIGLHVKLLVIAAQKGVSQENTFPPWNLQRMSAEAATCIRKPHGRLRAVYLVVSLIVQRAFDQIIFLLSGAYAYVGTRVCDASTPRPDPAECPARAARQWIPPSIPPELLASASRRVSRQSGLPVYPAKYPARAACLWIPPSIRRVSR